MDNLIQFPYHLIQKERELAMREIEIEIEKHKLKNSIALMRKRKRHYMTHALMWSAVGSLSTLCLITILLSL
tara:strand:- start:261 stop:476 length:216 start_codon:yes stop_codon:yes gene_type:complete